MSRAGRLLRLAELLRSRRTAVAGAALAHALGVSLRTLYRDVEALRASGAPIEGEAGVGYRMGPGWFLPPLRFTAEEVQALLVGVRLTEAFTDPELGRAARAAETRIRAILDDGGIAAADRQPYRAPVAARDAALRETHLTLRRACEAREMLQLGYRDAQGQESVRVVWPLGLVAWVGRWTLLAWCETREDYRNFRLDRVAAIERTGERFPARADRSLADYLSRIEGAAD